MHPGRQKRWHRFPEGLGRTRGILPIGGFQGQGAQGIPSGWPGLGNLLGPLGLEFTLEFPKRIEEIPTGLVEGFPNFPPQLGPKGQKGGTPILPLNPGEQGLPGVPGLTLHLEGKPGNGMGNYIGDSGHFSPPRRDWIGPGPKLDSILTGTLRRVQPGESLGFKNPQGYSRVPKKKFVAEFTPPFFSFAGSRGGEGNSGGFVGAPVYFPALGFIPGGLHLGGNKVCGPPRGESGFFLGPPRGGHPGPLLAGQETLPLGGYPLLPGRFLEGGANSPPLLCFRDPPGGEKGSGKHRGRKRLPLGGARPGGFPHTQGGVLEKFARGGFLGPRKNTGGAFKHKPVLWAGIILLQAGGEHHEYFLCPRREESYPPLGGDTPRGVEDTPCL